MKIIQHTVHANALSSVWSMSDDHATLWSSHRWISGSWTTFDYWSESWFNDECMSMNWSKHQNIFWGC